MSVTTERQWYDRPQPGWTWCWAWCPDERRSFLLEWCHHYSWHAADADYCAQCAMDGPDVDEMSERGWLFTCADHDIPEAPG